MTSDMSSETASVSSWDATSTYYTPEPLTPTYTNFKLEEGYDYPGRLGAKEHWQDSHSRQSSYAYADTLAERMSASGPIRTRSAIPPRFSPYARSITSPATPRRDPSPETADDALPRRDKYPNRRAYTVLFEILDARREALDRCFRVLKKTVVAQDAAFGRGIVVRDSPRDWVEDLLVEDRKGVEMFGAYLEAKKSVEFVKKLILQVDAGLFLPVGPLPETFPVEDEAKTVTPPPLLAKKKSPRTPSASPAPSSSSESTRMTRSKKRALEAAEEPSQEASVQALQEEAQQPSPPKRTKAQRSPPKDKKPNTKS